MANKLKPQAKQDAVVAAADRLDRFMYHECDQNLRQKLESYAREKKAQAAVQKRPA